MADARSAADKSRRGRGSRQKGNRFEVEIAKAIAARIGCPYEECCRTPSSGALVERSDLRFSARVRKLFPWFVEAKRRENWSLDSFFSPRASAEIWRWYEDAKEKAAIDPSYRGGQPPPILLVLGRNLMEPLVLVRTLDLADYGAAVPDDWSRVNSLRIVRGVGASSAASAEEPLTRYLIFPLSHFLGHYVRPFGAAS